MVRQRKSCDYNRMRRWYYLLNNYIVQILIKSQISLIIFTQTFPLGKTEKNKIDQENGGSFLFFSLFDIKYSINRNKDVFNLSYLLNLIPDTE